MGSFLEVVFGRKKGANCYELGGGRVLRKQFRSKSNINEWMIPLDLTKIRMNIMVNNRNTANLKMKKNIYFLEE